MNFDKIKKNGVSGIMRIKNDAEFIEASVDSCIDALDELIIVYNDCSDNSPDIIELVRQKYPDKIRTFEYKEKVYSVNLTKEEYEYAKKLPTDSPHLLCNYYNFALSKVTCKYALKIDADQIYFTEKLKWWCDIFRAKKIRFRYSCIIGAFIWGYSRIISKINVKTRKIYPLIPFHNSEKSWLAYSQFVAYFVHKTHRPLSLSGVDVYKDHDWFVTIGKKNNIFNILPPYNGVGDHLIFRVGKDTYYRPDDCEFYNKLRNDNYSLIERFVHNQGNPITIGVCWFHINAMRKDVVEKVQKAKDAYPNYFVPIQKFTSFDYNRIIEPKIDKNMLVHFQNVLFQFIHQYDAFEINKYLHKLNNIR